MGETTDSDWKGSFVARIKGAINNLVTLEIVTAVGKVKATGTGKRHLDVAWDDEPVAILTQVDLLQGDIKTCFHEDFVTGKYASLRDFHETREKQGHQIVKDNIQALKELLEFVKGLE
jgi:hypothetical protein